MNGAAAADAVAYAPVVVALGCSDFAAALLAALNREVRVDHVCLMRFASRKRAPVLESASWRGGTNVPAVQHAYLGGLWRHDPVLALPVQRGVQVLVQRGATIAEPTYRAACYSGAGVSERLSVAVDADNQLIALNLYRLDDSGAFGERDRAAIEAVAPLLAALAVQHAATMGMRLRSRDRADRIEVASARIAAIGGALTRREREVLARALVGMTSMGIALDLGIGVASVLTYRKRGYARLGVTSQAELFALCL